MKTRQLTLSVFFLLIANAITGAQSLPGKQTAAVWLPSNVKIDGKADEWNNKYAAYNNATEIYYTISNNEDNLYLIIHSVKSRIIEKIIEGGISFTITPPDRKMDLTVLFPLLSMNKCRSLLFGLGINLTEDMNSHMMKEVQPNIERKTANSVASVNDELGKSLKEIKVSGINAITDTIAGVGPETPYYRYLPLRKHLFKIIPITNKDGIHAMVQFGSDLTCTYELKVPLKHLELTANGSQKFKYRITINSRGQDERPQDIIRRSPPPNVQMLEPDLESPTSFSSEYTLAKKP